jgi:hypothetical protein
MSDDRITTINEALEPIAHYEMANNIPYLPLQVINSLEGHQKEKFLYLLDRFCCDFVKEEKVQLKITVKR